MTRYNRSSNWKLKATAGALAVVGGAVGGVVLTNEHATIHDSAYSYGFGESGWAPMLASAMTGLSQHGQSSFASTRALQELAAFRGFGSQFMFTQHHKHSMLAFERGQIVLITHHFLLVRGLNGQLTVWSLTRNTAVKSVVTTPAAAQTTAPAAVPTLTTGTATQAVTGGTSLASVLNNTAPAAPTTTTISITTGTTTITITVTGTATVAPMAKVTTPTTTTVPTTTTTTTTPTTTTTTPTTTTTTPTTTTTVPTAALTWHGLAAGDVVFVAGSVRGHTRTAQLVLIEALATTTNPAVATTPAITPTPAATPTVTATTTITPTPPPPPTFPAAPTATPTPPPRRRPRSFAISISIELGRSPEREVEALPSAR